MGGLSSHLFSLYFVSGDVCKDTFVVMLRMQPPSGDKNEPVIPRSLASTLSLFFFLSLSSRLHSTIRTKHVFLHASLIDTYSETFALPRPLSSWVENECVLIGDACHPMPSYVAQSAAQAIEDAGLLNCALSLACKHEIDAA